MRGLVAVVSAMMIIGTSQASTTQNGSQPSLNPTTIGSPAKTATKKDRAPANYSAPRIPKPKIFRSNPYRVVYFKSDANDSDIPIQDEDIQIGYRRQDLEKVRAEPTPDDPEGFVTEEIRWKLFLARTAAMLKYKEVHG